MRRARSSSSRRASSIYTLVVLSRVFGGGTIVTQVAFPLMLLISQGMYLGIFYWLARRKSRTGRSGHEFLILSAYSTGFTLPIMAAPQWLQIVAPLLGALAILLLCIPLYVYLLRLWSDFWALTKRRVFCYLMATAVLTTFVWGAAGVAYGLLVLAPQNA